MPATTVQNVGGQSVVSTGFSGKAGAGCTPFEDNAARLGIHHHTDADLPRPHAAADGTVEIPPELEAMARQRMRGASDEVYAYRDTSNASVPGSASDPANESLADPARSGQGGMGDASSRSSNGMAGMVGGIAIGDIDGDGCMDLVFADRDRVHLYAGSCGDPFVDESDRLGEGGHGIATATLLFDFDNDGDPDLFICRTETPSGLLRNDGGWSFVDVSAVSGVGVESACYGAAAADIDLDGDLDLVVANYYHWWVPGVDTVTDQSDPEFLYLNNGDGTFTDVAGAWGLKGDGPTLAVAFADYDADGRPDLAIANDFGHAASLWHNAGDHFERTNKQTGFDSQRDGMGIVWADFHNAGVFDIYVSNIFAHEGGGPSSGNFLFHYDAATGKYVDESRTSQTYNALWSWGGAAFDADSDGDLDLFVPNGYVDDAAQSGAVPPPAAAGPGGLIPTIVTGTPRPFAGALEPNRFFENRGDGVFDDHAPAWGIGTRTEGRGAATGDLDADGRVDLVATAVSRRPEVFLNHAPQGNSIEILLQGSATGAGGAAPTGIQGATGGVIIAGQAATGTAQSATGTRFSNRDAVGTRVEATWSGHREVQQREAGSGYLSQSSPVLHFGLATQTKAQLTVTWPSGLVQTFRDVPAGRFLLLEGGALQQSTQTGAFK